VVSSETTGNPAPIHLEQEASAVLPTSPLRSVTASSESSMHAPTSNPHLSTNLGLATSPLKLQKVAKKSTQLQNKTARNSGKSYFTRKGKFVLDKTFKFQICACKYDCKRLTEDERREVFKRYWEMNNWQAQCNFITSSVTVKNCDKTRIGQNSRKQNSRIFRIANKRVCKVVFLNTLRISNKKLDYCLRKKSRQLMCSPDKRGKVTPNKTPESTLKLIDEYLDSIPKYKSHYSLSDKKYFDENLTFPVIYNMYCKREEQNARKPVSKPIFRNRFNSYNVGIYAPRTDTCQNCDALNIKKKVATEEETTVLEAELNKHLNRAKKARQLLQTATSDAKTNPDTLVFTFDMQKNAPLPRLNTSLVFYKRQLWAYNLGIHTCANRKGYMAVWTENEGKRGSNEVCSSIWEFLQNIDLTKVSKIKTFSDCCGGQNRNKNIICFFMWVCNNLGIESWEHTYMESGHSYLPNDQDFSTIEKRAKMKSVFSKQEWIELIECARARLPFTVIQMHGKMLSFSTLSSCRKFDNCKTTNSEKFNFLKLKSFKVTQKSDSVLYTTEEDSERFQHTMNYPLLEEMELSAIPLCEQSFDISSEKYKDLMSLIPYIPDGYRDFYRELPHQ